MSPLFLLEPIAAGRKEGLQLQREDSVHIASINLKHTSTVTINGGLTTSGTYREEEGLSLKSLILKAVGFADNAAGKGIEISRRKRDVKVNESGSDIAELITFDDTRELSSGSTDITLQPFDINPNGKALFNKSLKKAAKPRGSK